MAFKQGTKAGKQESPKSGGDKAKKPQWLKKNTKPANPKETRAWGDRPYYWCDTTTGGNCKGKWRAHKPSECKGLAGKQARKQTASPTDKATKKQRKEKALKVIEAQEALLKQLDDEADDE